MVFRFGERNSFGKERLIVVVISGSGMTDDSNAMSQLASIWFIMSKSRKSVSLSVCGLDQAKQQMGLFLDTLQLRAKQVKGRHLNQSGKAMSYVTAFKRGFSTTSLDFTD